MVDRVNRPSLAASEHSQRPAQFKMALDPRGRLAQPLPAGQINMIIGRTGIGERKRIAIGTYTMLGTGAADTANRHILIASDPVEMLGSDYGRQTVAKARQARCYGLVPLRASHHVSLHISRIYCSRCTVAASDDPRARHGMAPR